MATPMLGSNSNPRDNALFSLPGVLHTRGADMLDNEVRNATIALADLFDSFTAFTDQRNAKALAVARL